MPDVRVEAPVFLDRARTALGKDGYAAAWAEGEELTFDQALTLALGDSARGQ